MGITTLGGVSTKRFPLTRKTTKAVPDKQLNIFDSVTKARARMVRETNMPLRGDVTSILQMQKGDRVADPRAKRIHPRLSLSSVLKDEGLLKKTGKLRARISLLKQKMASVEDILRKEGRSVDGSHSSSPFLSTKGDFIGGNAIHRTQADIISGEDLDTFQRKNSLVQVQNFRINRAGEKRTSVGINTPINNIQLKSIKDIEVGGRMLGFAVGPRGKEITGEGFRDLTKALRRNKFLSGKKLKIKKRVKYK